MDVFGSRRCVVWFELDMADMLGLLPFHFHYITLTAWVLDNFARSESCCQAPSYLFILLIN